MARTFRVRRREVTLRRQDVKVIAQTQRLALWLPARGGE